MSPRATLPECSETELQQTLVEAAHLTGWTVAHFRPAQNRDGRWATHMQGDPGFPDLILVHAKQARLLALELKVGKNQLTEAQKRWRTGLERVELFACGAVRYLEVRPADLDDVLLLLKGTPPCSSS